VRAPQTRIPETCHRRRFLRFPAAAIQYAPTPPIAREVVATKRMTPTRRTSLLVTSTPTSSVRGRSSRASAAFGGGSYGGHTPRSAPSVKAARSQPETEGRPDGSLRSQARARGWDVRRPADRTQRPGRDLVVPRHDRAGGRGRLGWLVFETTTQTCLRRWLLKTPSITTSRRCVLLRR
jgi:hypothetical protein